MVKNIHLFQKQWAIVPHDAENPKIQTGSFGPCYVVTFLGGGYAAMAHIDDTTVVESIQDIFAEFIKHQVSFSEIKVKVMGGWKNHVDSFEWGQKILEIIRKQGFPEVQVDRMYTKFAPPQERIRARDLTVEEALERHYYAGALVDAQKQEVFIVTKPTKRMERLQDVQTERTVEMAKNLQKDPNWEAPLERVSLSIPQAAAATAQ